MAPVIVGDEAWSDFPNIKRCVETINAHPAAVRVQDVKGAVRKLVQSADEANREYLIRHFSRA